MIISTGLRTDIIHHYSDWLFERFREGVVCTRNPLFPNRVTRYLLQPDKVDAVLFCSKHYAPALGRLHEITDRFNTFFHYTLTAYGKDIEPNIPPHAERLSTLAELSRLVGKERLVWRFEPVFTTKTYPAERIAEIFAQLAEQIAPYVRGCIIGFLEMSAEIRERIPDLDQPQHAQKAALLRRFAESAAKYRLPLQTCGTRETFEECGVPYDGCYTLRAIGEANRCAFKTVRHQGNRRDCLCITSRDLGWYGSCPNLCRYCSTYRSEEDVRAAVARHDPHSPLLIGHISDNDELSDGVQESYRSSSRQLSLFDL